MKRYFCPLRKLLFTDQLLGAIHPRLSGKRISGATEVVEAAIR